MRAFKQSPNRTVMYAFIADFTRVEIIKVWKDKRYCFSRTGLFTVFDDKKQPAEGFNLLGNLLSSSTESLGFKELVLPTVPILVSSHGSNLACKVDNLIPLRQGTLKRAAIYSGNFNMEGSIKRRKQHCILKCSHKDHQVVNEIDKLPFLDHPSIPKLIASGHSKELGHIMVVEPLGTPIQELKERTSDLIWKFMKEVNDALCYAHKNDTLHCDVSPNNIVVADEKAILIDWGIAMNLDFIALTQFTGTSAFCSLPVLELAVVNKHPGGKKVEHMYEPRDDFESLFYTILYLLSKKMLPWMKTRDIESLYYAKFSWMHECWQKLLQDMELPKEMADQLNVMHQKLFINKDPVDSLF
jgi:serine/threonine protein kinase